MKTTTRQLIGTTELNLRFLQELGVASKDLDRIRDDLHKKSDFALGVFGGVTWSNLQASAAKLGLTLPTDKLTHLFKTEAAEAIIVKRNNADFPIPTVSRIGNDAAINIDSKRTVLAEGDGAKIYQKSVLEWLFVRRLEAAGNEAGFQVHGFANQKIEIEVPQGGSLMIIDKNGNQQMYGIRPAELTRGMMGDQPFTVKVLDKSKSVVLEKTFVLQADLSATYSHKMLDGTFSKRKSDDTNPERPRFAIGGESGCDRVLVKRDGRSFPIERYEQLLCPPHTTTQAIRTDGLTYLIKYHNGTEELDDPGYDWKKSADISRSDGRNVTFDWSLSESVRAKWTVNGLEIFNPHTEKPVVVFDPFFRSSAG